MKHTTNYYVVQSKNVLDFLTNKEDINEAIKAGATHFFWKCEGVLYEIEPNGEHKWIKALNGDFDVAAFDAEGLDYVYEELVKEIGLPVSQDEFERRIKSEDVVFCFDKAQGLVYDNSLNDKVFKQ